MFSYIVLFFLGKIYFRLQQLSNFFGRFSCFVVQL